MSLQKLRGLFGPNRKHVWSELAQRIERGEQKMFYATVGSPIGARELIALGESLRQEKIELRDMVHGIDDETTEADLEEHRKGLLSAFERVTTP